MKKTVKPNKLYKLLKNNLKGRTVIEYHKFKMSGAVTIDKYIDNNDISELEKILKYLHGVSPIGSTQFLYETDEVKNIVDTCECIVLDMCQTPNFKEKIYLSSKSKFSY